MAHPPYGFPLVLGSLPQFLALYTSPVRRLRGCLPFFARTAGQQRPEPDRHWPGAGCGHRDPVVVRSGGWAPCRSFFQTVAGSGRLFDDGCRPRARLSASLRARAVACCQSRRVRGAGPAEIRFRTRSRSWPPRRPPRFQYGWVRGMGSAAFVGGTVLSGFAIARFGLPSFIWLNAALLLATSVVALTLPRGCSLRPRAPAHPGRDPVPPALALVRLAHGESLSRRGQPRPT